MVCLPQFAFRLLPVVVLLAAAALPATRASAQEDLVHSARVECEDNARRNAPTRQTSIVVANPHNFDINSTLRASPIRPLGETDAGASQRVPIVIPAKGSIGIDCEAFQNLLPASGSRLTSGMLFLRTGFDGRSGTTPELAVSARYTTANGRDALNQVAPVFAQRLLVGVAPDLRIEFQCPISTADSLRWRIYNSGRGVAPPTVAALIVLDNPPIFFETPSLARGDSTRFRVEFPEQCETETCQILILADVRDSIEEPIESNNLFSRACDYP